MDKPSKSSKRPREEGEECGLEKGRLYLQKFLEYDTDKLAAVGMRDVKVIADLEKFCGKIQVSIASVKKTRDNVEKERKKREREERTKIRKQLVAEKRCFQCKAFDKGLNPCVEFTHEGKESGDGVLFCDDCHDKVVTHSCFKCSSFLHKELGKDSRCGVNCRDDCYVCKSCGKAWCLPCAEADNADVGRHCRCSFYCNNCADDHITTDCCCNCEEEESYCNKCSYIKTMKNCDGECNEPLCNDCVRHLACGLDAHLCGNCDYDCTDCDICSG